MAAFVEKATGVKIKESPQLLAIWDAAVTRCRGHRPKGREGRAGPGQDRAGKKKGQLARPGSRTAKLAELAEFYGPQVLGRLEPRLAQAVLEANMARLKAQKRLESDDLSTMHAVDDLYDLAMEATGSESAGK